MSAKWTVAVVGWSGGGRGEGACRTLVGEVGARRGVDLVVSEVWNICRGRGQFECRVNVRACVRACVRALSDHSHSHSSMPRARKVPATFSSMANSYHSFPYWR